MKSENKWFKFIGWFSSNPKTTGFIFFLMLNCITAYIVSQRYEIIKEAKNTQMTNDLKVIHQNIEQSLKNCYTTTLTLALTIDDEGYPKDFESISKQLLESNNSINAVQLVPNGIIKYTYPIKGNEAALGLNILQSKLLKKEALKSIQNQKMYFAGPFELKQGGLGIVGRLPVYKNNCFWGFSAVIIKLEKLLTNSGINAINKSKYYFQLSKKNPISGKEVFFLPENKNLKDSNYVSSIIPDGNWKLFLIDKKPNGLLPALIVPSLLGLFISLGFGHLTYIFVNKPAQLEILIQEQAAKLFRSELQFKTIFEQAGIGIASVNLETGQFIEINNYFCEIIGYTKNEIKEKTFKEITHLEDIENDLAHLEKLNSGALERYNLEKRYFSKTGAIIWVSLTVSPLYNEKGGHMSNIAFVEDITIRKNNEKIIQNSKQKIESLINTIDGIVWEADSSINYTFISKKVEDILGYTSEEWLSCRNFWINHIHPEDKDSVLKYCLEKIKLRQDHDFEYRMIAKNGSIIWLRDIVNIETNDHNNLLNLRGIMIDITKTKEIENQLHKSLKLVTEQNKRLLNFSYIVSHNLRSHTSNITSIISLIEITESKEEMDQMLGLLKTVSNSLNEAMLNLNEVVNIQANVSLITEDIILKNYIENTLNILSEQIHLKKVTITTTVLDDVIVTYNPAYLQSILYNLISNAIKYRDPKKEAVVTISSYQKNKKTILQITDNGIGIDLDKNGNKIFGMYKTFTNNKDSKGIGLFITKNQIDAMGGNIIVESEVNIGTTFKICIV